MKNIFGVNAKQADEGSFDGKPFVVATVDGDLKRRREELQKELEAHPNQATPGWLKAIFYIGLYGGGACLLIFSEMVTDSSFKELSALGYWFLGVGVALLAIFGLSFYVLKRRSRLVESSSSFRYAKERETRVLEECRVALGLPNDAKQCDVFGYSYKLKSNGKAKSASGAAQYAMLVVSASREGEGLLLSDFQMKLKIPFENVRRFYRVNKRALVMGWNKETPFNKGEYKQYKIRASQYGALTIKPYYVLEINYRNEDYELKFPCYEYETFRELLGRDAEL